MRDKTKNAAAVDGEGFPVDEELQLVEGLSQAIRGLRQVQRVLESLERSEPDATQIENIIACLVQLHDETQKARMEKVSIGPE